MTLDAANSGLSGSTLTLNFQNATTIPAGTPFIIKWDNTGVNLTETDLVFSGVTINSTSTEVSFTGGKFKGTYKPISYTAENKSILLVGGDNLYWPEAGASINAFRAYFDLGTNEAREFVVNFGNDDIATSMLNAQCFMLNEADAWYSLDGRKLDKQPTKKGLYIHNGRKVVIK